MADSEQKNFIDFVDSSFGDSGEDDISSIQPVTDGEGASQTVFRRPSENLRHRTEVFRSHLRNLQYYRDFNNWVIEGEDGHSIEWGGVVANGGNGEITQVGDITIRPFLTPASSTKGTLKIGTSGTNAVDYVVQSSAYASEGVDQILVEHRDAGSGASLEVEISEGPVKRIVVLFDSSNSSHDSEAVETAVNTAISADSFLDGKLLAEDDGINGETIDDQDPTRVEGTADQEAHLISAGTLDSFTSSNPLSEGDTLAIWYRYLVEPDSGFAEDPKGGVAGGRWESNPDRGTATIPVGSLFITSQEPEKIPGAVPVCKVINDELVFVDGSRFTKGVATQFGASMVIDDSSFGGNPTVISNGGIPPLGSPTIQDAFDSIDGRLGNLRGFTYVITDGTNSTGGDFDGVTAVQDAISALSGSGGTLFIRRGEYELGSSLSVPANVKLIGEQISSTTLLLTAGPGAVDFASRSGAINLKIASDAGTNTINVSGPQVVIENVRFEDIESITDTSGEFTLRNIDCSPTRTTDIFLQGASSSIEQVSSIKSLEFNSVGCSVSRSVLFNVTSDVGSIFDSTKVPNSVVDSIIFETDTNQTLVECTEQGSLVIDRCIILNDHAAATDPVIHINHSDATVVFRDCYLSGDTSGTYVEIDSTSNAGVRFEGCSLVSQSPTLIITSGESQVLWNNTYISDDFSSNTQIINHTGSTTKSVVFNKCYFRPSKTTNIVSINAVDSGATSFLNCVFDIKTDTGVFAGTESGVSASFIQSHGLIKDCTIDLNGQQIELETGSGDPQYLSGSLVISSTGHVDGLSLINVDEHMHFDNNGRLASFSGITNKLSILTVSNPPSGGSANWPYVIWARDKIFETSCNTGLPADAFIRTTNSIILDNCTIPAKFINVPSGSNDDVTLTNCDIDVGEDSLEVSVEGYIRIINNDIASIATTGNIPIFLVESSNITITNNRIHVSGAGDMRSVVSYDSGSSSSTMLFSNNMVTANAATGTEEIFQDEPGTYVVVGNVFNADSGTWENTNLTGTGDAKVVDLNSFA